MDRFTIVVGIALALLLFWAMTPVLNLGIDYALNSDNWSSTDKIFIRFLPLVFFILMILGFSKVYKSRGESSYYGGFRV